MTDHAADEDLVMSDTAPSTRRLVDELVDQVVDGVPGVLGAVIASTDGFVLAARLPDEPHYDSSAIAAMSAATLALSSRLVQLNGDQPAEVCVQRSATAQVCVFAIATSGVLTIVADESADTGRIERIGREVTQGLANSL